MNAARKTSSNGKKVRKGGAVVSLLVVFIVAMVANFGYSIYQSAIDSERLTAAEELRVLSQQISNNASEAVSGNLNAFDTLAITRNNFETNFLLLQLSINAADFKFTPKDVVSTALQNTGSLWVKVKGNTDSILESRNTVLDLHDVAALLSKSIPELQDLSEKVVTRLIAIGGTANQLRHAARQVWYAERLIGSVQKILSGASGAQEAEANFSQNIINFGDVLDGMLNGNTNKGISRVNNASVRASLNDIESLFNTVKNNLNTIINATEDLNKVHTASSSIFNDASKMLASTSELSKAYSASTDVRLPGNPLLSAALLIVVMILLAILYAQQRRTEKETIQYSEELANREKEQNDQNQEAIIRLLDEMEGLADGDLTSHATVTEDFTGAIADAMNFTIDQLRSLVSAINHTVVQVSTSSSETRSIATELAQSSRNQAQEIKDASNSISNMAASVEQVSTNANETSEMAQESVAIAKSGGDIVRNTIRAMDTIREQIQETSKRIKRLGESSQEIGDIVALINDISDQTNILALNAAIQATLAGEAGRGFAVVSDEVQRLAERSGNAAKQIEGLVKTIQTDTNQAVISMESSTSEVVSGARFAQDAGVAL
jgi:twitching motility protein PilJ